MNTISINKPGKSTVVMIMCPIGAYYEGNYYKGISHFLEHIMFKGTKNRTAKQISSSIENIGGELNAFTGWEITAYHAKIGNSYKNIAIETLKDMLYNSVFRQKEIDKERKVIIQEMKREKDNPDYYICDLFNERLYDKTSGLYIPVIGTEKTLNKINRKEILNYLKKYYNSKNLTMIVIGNTKNYEKINNRIYSIKENKINRNLKDELITKKGITQAKVLIGNNVKVNLTEEEQIFLPILLKSLYNDMSGRLFTTIREKNNLVYSIYFYIIGYRNKEFEWNIGFGLNKENINKAKELIIKELTRPISKKEREIIINKSMGSLELMFDDNFSIAHSIAHRITTNTDYKIFLYNYKKSIKKLAQNINDYIKAFDFKNNLMVGLIGGK